jgi:hypothetical protein
MEVVRAVMLDNVVNGVIVASGGGPGVTQCGLRHI